MMNNKTLICILRCKKHKSPFYTISLQPFEIILFLYSYSFYQFILFDSDIPNLVFHLSLVQFIKGFS